MTRLRWFTLAASIAGLVVGGAVALAQGPGPRGLGPASALPLRALNLSEAQREQFRQLVEQNREQARVALQSLRAAMEAQRKAVQTVPVDEQLIRSTTQALAEAQTNVALQRARLRADLFALLTPEQQATATKLEAERAGRSGQRFQRRRQDPR
jgi:protein CpxP